MSNCIYTPRSNKKLGENDGVANCPPTILWIVRKWYWWPFCTPTVLWFGFLDIRKVSLYPSWPPPILWTIQTIKNWGFGNLIGAGEKSKNWASIIKIHKLANPGYQQWPLTAFYCYPLSRHRNKLPDMLNARTNITLKILKVKLIKLEKRAYDANSTVLYSKRFLLKKLP